MVTYQVVLNVLQATLEQGSLYALVALALLITFQVIRFPDLTPDGSFTLGAAVVGTAIHACGAPFMGVVAAFIAGAISGSVTAFLNSKLKISRILSGILVMTGLYTVSLRIMGRGNLQLIQMDTLLTPLEVLSESGAWVTATLVVVALLSYLAIWGLLRSEFGLFLIATGLNPTVAESKGKSADCLALFGVALANGIIASSGALACQLYGYADINLGVGTLVSGLACLFLGRGIFRSRSVESLLLAPWPDHSSMC